MDVLITNKLFDAIKMLRDVSESYANMDEPTQRRFRNLIYQRTGKLGKLVLADKGKLLIDISKESQKLTDVNK